MKQFSKFQQSVISKITNSAVQRTANCYGHLVVETCDSEVYVDHTKTSFLCLEEAVSSIKQQKQQQDILKDIQQESYSRMSINKVASIISKHHNDIKITDTLIESYLDLASSKFFTTDPVAFDIRKSQPLGNSIRGYFDVILEDGSVVLVTEDVQQRINTLLQGNNDVVSYMKQNQQNFLEVLNLIEE